jgi:hypothetical protein
MNKDKIYLIRRMKNAGFENEDIRDYVGGFYNFLGKYFGFRKVLFSYIQEQEKSKNISVNDNKRLEKLCGED